MNDSQLIAHLLNNMNQDLYMKHKRALDALAQAIDFESMLASGFMRELAKELTSEKH